FYANNYFWSKNAAFPGDQTVQQTAAAECNKAFQSYVGIAYSKSRYTWTLTVPNQSSWPGGERALHCMAYYKTSAVPSGETLHGSIKGTAK
ncbi:MAG TPA: septum formation family protein, partial [Streptosporangiaceae bacterium]|nr:septum formation family protein [Streptosporangiaceae bacterium]